MHLTKSFYVCRFEQVAMLAGRFRLVHCAEWIVLISKDPTLGLFEGFYHSGMLYVGSRDLSLWY